METKTRNQKITFLPKEFLLKFKPARFFAQKSKFFGLDLALQQANLNIDSETFLTMIYSSAFFNFLFLCVVFMLLLYFANKNILIGPLIAIALIIIQLPKSLAMPKLIASKRGKSIERNLLPALQDMMVQLKSGVPLFTAIVNISDSNYGELSNEFKKAVNKINAGIKQENAMLELSEKNPSLFFRRAIWQIANGMRAGSNMSTILRQVIDNLNEQQLIDIQSYGSRLNPITMFYMLVVVIFPALAITVTIILSSLVSLETAITKLILGSIFFFIFIFQIIFIGLIKSRRPALVS